MGLAEAEETAERIREKADRLGRKCMAQGLFSLWFGGGVCHGKKTYQ